MSLIASVVAAALPLMAVTGAAPAGHEHAQAGVAGIVAPGTRLELVREGFDGTEGPVRLADGSLLFTENRADRIVHVKPDGSSEVFLDETGGANALAINAAGEVLAVQTKKPALAVIHPRDKARVLAEGFEGRPFNRPNDLVIDRAGGVFFTDPGASAQQLAEGRAVPVSTAPPAPPVTAIYYRAPDGRVTRIDGGFGRPNGVQLSPDEKVLYVADTYGEHVLAYDIVAGRVGPRREFARLAGFRQTEHGPSSGADGLATDARGNVYVASSAGVQVFAADGEPLGIIATPKPPQNLAFAGADRRTLFIVGRGSVWKIATLVAGNAERAK
jgi:gluconolactonase